MGFDEQGLICTCLLPMSFDMIVSPSSELTEGLWGNQCILIVGN